MEQFFWRHSCESPGLWLVCRCLIRLAMIKPPRPTNCSWPREQQRCVRLVSTVMMLNHLRYPLCLFGFELFFGRNVGFLYFSELLSVLSCDCIKIWDLKNTLLEIHDFLLLLQKSLCTMTLYLTLCHQEGGAEDWVCICRGTSPLRHSYWKQRVKTGLKSEEPRAVAQPPLISVHKKIKKFISGNLHVLMAFDLRTAALLLDRGFKDGPVEDSYADLIGCFLLLSICICSVTAQMFGGVPAPLFSPQSFPFSSFLIISLNLTLRLGYWPHLRGSCLVELLSLTLDLSVPAVLSTCSSETSSVLSFSSHSFRLQQEGWSHTHTHSHTQGVWSPLFDLW